MKEQPPQAGSRLLELAPARAANERTMRELRAAVLVPVIVLVVLLVLLIAAFTPPVVSIVASVVALAALAWFVTLLRSATRGPRLLLAAAGARPAAPGAHPRYANLVEGLCAEAGLPAPALHVVESPAMNAFAVAGGHGGAALVVTTGALEGLNRVELEGLVAHEIAHIGAGDTEVLSLAALLGSGPALVTELGRAPAAAVAGRGGTTFALAVRPFAATVEGVLRRSGPGTREPDADLRGSLLTRFPPGLEHAIRKVSDRRPESVPGYPVLRHLLFVNDGQPETTRSPSHASVANRITALEEV